ncbi:hypothetical protein [Bradyrhizobium sp. 153]|uniref:hypothetical protein n=1 Tax=Bradyrhizobium sp. 153 TaxID=2782627 RepID=UPI001FFA7A7D|nr:hypothetical protein [Bradyrhizobium sp. 153]MCK1668677.1 hypothetical protein [Bradyrhizobium sp. 153]
MATKLCVVCSQPFEAFNGAKACPGECRSKIKRKRDALKCKRWRENNPKRHAARIRRWREENRERDAANAKRSRQKNYERNEARTKRWREANRERYMGCIKRANKRVGDAIAIVSKIAPGALPVSAVDRNARRRIAYHIAKTCKLV